MYESALTRRIVGPGAEGFKTSDRAEALVREGKDIIILTLGDPDFDTPSSITDAAVAALRSGRTHYTPVPGVRKLREAIAAEQRRIDGGAWDFDNVVVFPGAQSALFSAMMCVADRESTVVTFDPTYATYAAVVGASGARNEIVPMELPWNGGSVPRIDFDRMQSALKGNVSAILLNSPNNPGGFTFHDDDLQRLANLCVERSIWLLSDEVYRDLLYDGRSRPVSALSGMQERTIIINSLSKSHAMTGWRLGWAVAPRPMARHLERFAQCSLFGSPPFIQNAAIEALTTAETYVRPMRAEYQRRLCALLDALQGDIMLKCLRPVGGMFVLIDISRTGLKSGIFAERALDEAGVAVVPGSAFSLTGGSYVRVSFATDIGRIVEGVNRLKAFAASLAPL